ncbi:ATP-binding protein [Algoriphagus sp. A40]|uniref:ATP-binding protein n=1 Tax=Algoriphagus sp. A40 TaxID=1945863 RepID=UPI000986B66D|nr:ATP-binding protein [Algoriphagus sp. A40]OOG73348.1 hypothetical protein B0E43_13535 [Algoriphagus sp. A40]
MNFCQNYFQKDLDQITADDLIQFFNSTQKETQFLEFKSSGDTNVEQVFNKNLKPAICSFLNSEGGILIYGAPREDRKNPGNPENFKLKPYPKEFLGDHDSIIRKISDGITPMPIGIRLKEVEFTEGFVAVFEIQKSVSKPHQTENIYQIRIDGQKKPAPHYLIEAMMKQITYPDMRGYIKVHSSQYKADGTTLEIIFSVLLVNFSEYQNEKNIRFALQIDGPMDLVPGSSKDKISAKKTKFFKFENAVPRTPVRQEFRIEGNFGMISKNKEIKLTILFHGESCPPKVTVYQFDIESRNHRGYLAEGKAKRVLDNIPLADYQKLKGFSCINESISDLVD